MNSDCHSEFLGETIQVTGTDGVRTAATVAYRDDTDLNRLVLILPPNPILGGDTQNNVVQALLTEAVSRGVLAMTCEYRGVTDGNVGDVDVMTYWEELARLGDYSAVVADCLSAVASVRHEFECGPCHGIIGYSFGSYLGLQCASKMAVACVGISPPLLEYDFRSLTAHLDHTHFLVAPADVFCPAEMASREFSGQSVVVQTVESDDHFFRGTEKLLAQKALSALGIRETER